MSKVLDPIFEKEMEKLECIKGTEEWGKRSKCYDILSRTFTPSQSALFDDYYMADTAVDELRCKHLFVVGVKYGFELAETLLAREEKNKEKENKEVNKE